MQKNATILIPDISGYTEFFSKTELEFSTGVLCELLNELMRVADAEFKVAEIEGDAILFYILEKKLSPGELISYCLLAYSHFHEYLIKIIERVADPEACRAAKKLDVKFIAHWGPVAEMNIRNFSKPVGLEIIKAHKLLKNSIESKAYILMTEAIATDLEINSCELVWKKILDWKKGSEEYEVIGRVAYRYALLDSIRISADHTI
jgi:hypothetical protein